MRDPFNRTKVVLRHLPPGISQSVLMEQIDGRYKWFCFRSGKNSQKNQRYSRAYIDFKRPEDIVEFADFFDGHVFVNEKGAQFKTIVEYAPSQRVPKPWSKKDGREGTILKDPEYVEFLGLLAKPMENPPSSEIQLERREAERAGAPKEALIVTPLMDFVRQKRAAKSGSQRSSTNGKLSRRARGASTGNSSSSSTKRGSEKPKYVLRDSTKGASGKEKPTYLLVPRREDPQVPDKSVLVAAGTGTEVLEDETVLAPATDGATSGASRTFETGKKRLLLPKGKEKEVSHASAAASQQQSVTSPLKNSPVSATSKQTQQCEASGRMIRSILLNKEPRQNQLPMSGVQSEQQMQTVSTEKDKRPPRSTNIHSVLKDHIASISSAASAPDPDTKRPLDDKINGNDLHGVISVLEKQDRCTRNKDRPDHGVWTPLRRSDGSQVSDESLSSSSSQPSLLLSDSLEGMSISQQVAHVVSKYGDDILEDMDGNSGPSFKSGKSRNLDLGIQNSRVGCGTNSLVAYDSAINQGEMKVDMLSASRSGDMKTLGSGRTGIALVENGSHRHAGRRGPVHGLKEVDSSLNLSEGKPSKKGGATGYGSYERQVWVQKSGSGT